MTLEEAIKNREECLRYLEDIGAKATPSCVEAVRWSVKALKALRPITREQVEKAWSGCSYCEDGDLLFEHSGLLLEISRAKDFDRAGIMVEGVGGFSIHFCPMCGRPLNDEAVDMVMERLEALYEQ